MYKYLNLIAILAVLAPIVASADIATLTPTDDADVQEYFPNSANGSHHIFGFGYYSSGGYSGYINGLIKFDISSYSGETVNVAQLYLYVSGADSTPPEPSYIARNTSDWDEETVTWNTKPGGTDEETIPGPIGVGGWLVLDVTAPVQSFVDGVYDNHGFQIYRYNTDCWYNFWSKEYSNSTYHPYLYLDFTPSVVESTSLGEIKAVFK